MVTKTITITKEAYESIRNLKNENESFSQLFIRISKNKVYSKSFLGILSKDSKIKENVKKYREEVEKDFEERQDVFFG